MSEPLVSPDSTLHPGPRTGEEPPARSSSEAPPGPRILLTESALAAVREMLDEEGLLEEGGLRITAGFGAGCATPLRFGIVMDPESEPGDLVLSGGGIRVFVSEKHAWALDGLEVDYVDSAAFGTGFAFRHPRGAGGRSC